MGKINHDALHLAPVPTVGCSGEVTWIAHKQAVEAGAASWKRQLFIFVYHTCSPTPSREVDE